MTKKVVFGIEMKRRYGTSWTEPGIYVYVGFDLIVIVSSTEIMAIFGHVYVVFELRNLSFFSFLSLITFRKLKYKQTVYLIKQRMLRQISFTSGYFPTISRIDIHNKLVYKLAYGHELLSPIGVRIFGADLDWHSSVSGQIEKIINS